MKFLARDFCGNLQVRVVIFYKQVDDDVLYCGIATQHSPAPAYSLYLSAFLSFLTLNNDFLSKISL